MHQTGTDAKKTAKNLIQHKIINGNICMVMHTAKKKKKHKQIINSETHTKYISV